MNKILAVVLAVVLAVCLGYIGLHNKKTTEAAENSAAVKEQTAETAETAVTGENTADAAESNTLPTEITTAPVVYSETLPVSTSGFVPETVTATVYQVTEATRVLVTTATEKPATDTDYVYRGAFISSDGKVLWYSNGNERKANPEYDMCVSNLISKKSAQKLDTVFNDLLRVKNPSEIRSSTGNPLGTSLMLTLNAEKQKQVFDYLNANNLRAAVTLLDDSGGIEVAASTPGFSNNVSVVSGSSSYYNNVFREVPLGSVAKISSGVVLAFNHIMTMDDPGKDDVLSIVNWDYGRNANYPVKGETIFIAFVNSSNYFFGKGYSDLGADRIRLPLDMFFSYSKPVVCDFGTLERSFDFEDNVKRAHAAFGQRCRMTMLNICMDARAAVTGELVTPHILQAKVDTKTGQTLEKLGRKTVVPDTVQIPDEYRKDVCNGMKQLADNSKLSAEGWELYAKTGSAASEGLFADDILSTVVVARNTQTGEVKTLMLTVFNGSEHGYHYASDTKAHVHDLVNMLF